ncbi:metalloregulator ArsR/SmtB family transcription factor [Ferrimicrobium sp.]|uniref:ArsR/SmtB family transcription factor n=1 Tax=Ferrimicrobium sp. TaxID=2926050 RepID=UPI00262F531D|nr:metalloregulator ArsR/SmtB family transcription factor [Ferrimicrobium sp.]
MQGYQSPGEMQEHGACRSTLRRREDRGRYTPTGMHNGNAPSDTLESRAAKTALFDALAEMAKAMSTGRRIEIIDLLAQGERSVDTIAAEIGQSLANTSHHLRFLAQAGLVLSRREGTYVYYRLASVEVEELWLALRRTAEAQRADLPRLITAYVGPSDDSQVVDQAELLHRLQHGSVTILDVRPEAEYRAGHIPGARSFPYRQISEELCDLPSDGEIIAYCRGPYCVFAPDVVRFLRSKGIFAKRLRDGFPEWRRAGLPIAFGAETGKIPLDVEHTGMD